MDEQTLQNVVRTLRRFCALIENCMIIKIILTSEKITFIIDSPKHKPYPKQYECSDKHKHCYGWAKKGF